MRVSSLVMTCGACPAQWEGRLEDGRAIYIRYRWGTLQIGVGRTMNEAIDATFAEDPNGVRVLDERVGDDMDGVLSLSELRSHVATLAPELDLAGVVTDDSDTWWGEA